ncbi:exodeoxyribonuclease VII large subunit [Kineococcus rhizosphaerae]|uniref:Exodeoxyribonuclease 7 large subunit n=1 Tax=Kineococcus rhizosphaerae TaxID=559628 RepID=A0A2T0R491_9ACTN|nr:exodeoxyribonuclease VII large subunit [Kineococcus rhizosphaerae]PRY15188.1 exodeoxyribonuclease VII large subunit [Kineococcus rhizosphaerae]
MPADPTAPPPARRPTTAGETTAENPWPVRLLAAKMDAYIAKMPWTWVEGQVVQVNDRPGASVVFVTLRDADTDMSLPVTIARRVLSRLREALPDGLGHGTRVVVHAKPEFFAKRGSLSLAADDVRPVGVGELLARLEHLKRVLRSEGLFDASRKKELPFLPHTVGLVCGRASAAERDVVENARLRWPAVRFEVREVAVQGPNAVTEVVQALAELDADPHVEVVVLARGGGNVEDLLPFSNEALVRAVARARTPVVSAIGHEVDSPLVDLVADVRASTPTDAARLVVPDVAEELAGVAQLRARARRGVAARVEREEHALAALRSRPVLAAPHVLVETRAAEVDALRERARRSVQHRLERAGVEVEHLRTSVRALSPRSTLLRGYAVVQRPDGGLVRVPGDAPDGTRLRIRLPDGEVAATAG